MFNSNSRKLVVALGLVLIMFTLTRCGGKNQNALMTKTDPTPGTFTYNYTKLFSTACVECHVPGGGQNGATLDFSSQSAAYQSLTSSTVHGASSVGNCGSAKIVDSGNPSTSYLLAVLEQPYNVSPFPGTGSCAPYTVHLQDQNLTADEQSSLVTWIKNGAQND